MLVQFTSVKFHNFKAFKNYSVTLSPFNILVGPNNSGKSTILAAFRILAEATRKARARKPEPVQGPDGDRRGYHINLEDIPVATENVFCDYDDSLPAWIRFRLSNGNCLLLYFPERDTCILICEPMKSAITSPATFKTQYPCPIAFVPVLGPVEHNEPLYQQEAARQAMLSHRASRNFRNIWYHYPERFDEFTKLIRSTWPGMDIERPRIDTSAGKPRLHMFCLENRIPRELFWAGFGFQVWCQMLTYIVEANDSAILAIDEPDIYLHSDLQRQLLGILKSLGPDILIATHSTEIVSEADYSDIVVIEKKAKSAKRMSDPTQIQKVFTALGSNLNPTLTQLAKSRRALFVEGKDFSIISKFARKRGLNQVANRADFAVISTEGFNPSKVADVSSGIEKTLGMKIKRAVIFDSDFRPPEEIEGIIRELQQVCSFAFIHDRKEIENFLLVPEVLERAVAQRIHDRNKRSNTKVESEVLVSEWLKAITDQMKQEVQARFVADRVRYRKKSSSYIDVTTLTKNALVEFEGAWDDFDSRLKVVPGKEILAQFNERLMAECKVNVSASSIVSAFRQSDIPDSMNDLLDQLTAFGKRAV